MKPGKQSGEVHILEQGILEEWHEPCASNVLGHSRKIVRTGINRLIEVAAWSGRFTSVGLVGIDNESVAGRR